MPKKTYPGQHKFRIVQNEPKPIRDQSKQAKHRADARMQMANLRDRRLKQQHYNDVITEQIMIELALKRYKFNAIF
jgi:hypothetical protein